MSTTSRRLPATFEFGLRIIAVSVVIAVAFAYGHGTVTLWWSAGIIVSAMLLLGFIRHAVIELARAAQTIDKAVGR